MIHMSTEAAGKSVKPDRANRRRKPNDKTRAVSYKAEEQHDRINPFKPQ